MQLLTDIRFETGYSGRLLTVFSFLTLSARPFDIILADENLPLTDEQFLGYLEEAQAYYAEIGRTTMKMKRGDSPTLALMKRFNSEITREQYLAWVFGNGGYVPSAEEEAELPEEFRLPIEEAAEVSFESEEHTRLVKTMSGLQ